MGEEPTAADPAPPPRLGAPAPSPVPPPEGTMDSVEEPIADHLAEQLRVDGLTLDYVDCPRWSGSVPARMVCDGYLDGVVGQVQVELTRGRGGAVEYDAWLEEGVLATARLVRRLEDEGYTSVECGDVAAYPARIGLRLVCEVEDDGEIAYVAATVVDADGEVRIEDY